MRKHIPYDRAARLADQIFRIVSEVCYTTLSDPRLEGIQITQVRLTKDLRVARLYFHVLDATPARIEGIIHALKSACGFFKRAIGRDIQLRYMPEFEFFYDDTIDVREHIDEIFDTLEQGKTAKG